MLLHIGIEQICPSCFLSGFLNASIIREEGSANGYERYITRVAVIDELTSLPTPPSAIKIERSIAWR